MQALETDCECGRRIHYPAKHAGKVAKCPQCGGRVKLPPVAPDAKEHAKPKATIGGIDDDVQSWLGSFDVPSSGRPEPRSEPTADADPPTPAPIPYAPPNRTISNEQKESERRRYPALFIVSVLFRVSAALLMFAWLGLLGVVIASAFGGGVEVAALGMFPLISAAVVLFPAALFQWAAGEVIMLLIDVEENTRRR